MDFEFDDSSDRTCTVTLKYGEQEREMVHEQITTHSIALVFNLNPATIWLQECYGHRIYIPDEHGNFEVPRRVYRATVNGVRQDSPRLNVPTGSGIASTSSTSSANSITLTATSTPSDHSSASQLNRPFFQSVASGRSSKAKIKIVRADVTYSGNGKPHFSTLDAMFVDITPGNANQPSILSAVQDEFGRNFTIVGNDGFEIKDATATRDVKFWKTPSRKLFAIPKDQVKGKYGLSASDRNVIPDECGFQKSVREIHNKIEGLESKIWAKQGSVPPHFKQRLEDSLKCKICQVSPIKPPIIMAKCCTNIIGCQGCTDGWFSGPNALTKSCPICGTERGYANTARLHGLDELCEEVETSHLLQSPS